MTFSPYENLNRQYLVILEDVLRELVGSLQDEFDIEEPNIIELNGKYIVAGYIQIDDLNDKFGIYLASTGAVQ